MKLRVRRYARFARLLKINMEPLTFFDCNIRIGMANHPANSPVHEPGEIVEKMDYYGIEKALVFHKESMGSPVAGNDLLAGAIAGNPRFVGAAVLAPAYSGEFGDIGAYFKKIASQGFRAIRLFPAVHKFPLKALYLDTVLEQAQQYGMPVILDEIDLEKNISPLGTWGFSPNYDDIYELSRGYPDLNFIVIMTGMLTQRRLFAIMAKCPNVYYECSSFGYKNIENAYQLFGRTNLVFGSYFPIMEPGVLISYLSYADVPEEEKKLIAGGTLRRLIGA